MKLTRVILALLAVSIGAASGVRGAGNAMDKEMEARYAKLREEMVKYQIENRGIKDPLVLKAMRNVPRHQFMPESEWRHAYRDTPWPIGKGQTISQPYIVAIMTEVLALKGEEKVLEIGTGSGYQAAVLAEIAKEVYSIEIVKVLADRAKKTLERIQEVTNRFVKSVDDLIARKEKEILEI